MLSDHQFLVGLEKICKILPEVVSLFMHTYNKPICLALQSPDLHLRVWKQELTIKNITVKTANRARGYPVNQFSRTQ